MNDATANTIALTVDVDPAELRTWADKHADAGQHGVAHVLYQAAADADSVSAQALHEARAEGRADALATIQAILTTGTRHDTAPLKTDEIALHRGLAAHDAMVAAAARAEQKELDLAMHQAYRAEVVAEVAVYLGDDSDWDGIAAWCGGTIGSAACGQDGEYTGWIDIPGVGQVPERTWIVQRHDGTFAMRTEVEGPSSQSISTIKAQAIREVAESINLHRQVPKGGWGDLDHLCEDDVCLWWDMTRALHDELSIVADHLAQGNE